MTEKQQLEDWIAQSNHIVFFGGAGVSTESGIPDFRSVDGLYHQHYPWPPEEILSHHFFFSHTEDFYRFYREKLIVHAKPNPAHLRLAALEQQGKLEAVITQNIDGLHTAAGSKNVFELHGSIWRNHCLECGHKVSLKEVESSDTNIPHCPVCGGVVKPDVVLYEEGLDQQVLASSIAALRKADLLIVGGTSLAVYPAAGLLQYAQPNHLVVINRDPTPADREADLVIRQPIGQVLAQS